MRTRKLVTAALGAALVVAMLPATAGAQNKGTWTFTDFTPDPTSVSEDAAHHCHGLLPLNNPGETNSQQFKAKKAGTLTLVAHNASDWAVEVRDADGNVITGTDSGDPLAPESISASLSKGTYEVVYCNWAAHEPIISVDFSFK